MESTLIKSWDTSINFWVANPNFTSVTKFKEWMDKDKSKDKRDSSQVMWAIVLLLDMNTSNIWRNLAEVDKKLLIKEDFLKDKTFNWEDKQVKELIDEYTERLLTIAEKMLRNFNLKLIDRQKFIDDTAYDMENADQLDKMMINTSKIYSQYEDIKNMFDLEKNSGKTRGGIKESAMEQGLL
jgi:hypothetical protein